MGIKGALLATPVGRPAQDLYWAFLRRLDPVWWRNRRYDRQTVAVMRRVLSRCSNCVDVGCFKGEILAHIVKFAPDGQHYAFEPLPFRARSLREAFPCVRVYEYALNDAAGSAPFYHAVKHPANSGLDRRPDRPYENFATITVRTARLDDIVPDDLPIDFIKIDVEGGELRVLRGARRTLSRHRPYVVFEKGWGVSKDELYHLLVAECGLNLSTLGRWLAERPPMTLEDFLAADRDFYFLAHP